MTAVAPLLVAGGSAVLLLGVTRGRNARTRSLAERLQLPLGEETIVEDALPSSTIRRITSMLVDRDSHRLPRQRRTAVEVLQPILVGALAGVLVGFVTQQLVLGVVAAASMPLLGVLVARTAERRLRLKARAQVPTALSTLASSLEAGATLERSLAVLADRVGPPLGEELTRLVSEVELGGDVVVSIERVAERVGLEDLRWWAYAVGLQRRVGGPLAPITRNLAELVREREELDRELRVLTAEGRLSAYVLGALPVVVFLAVQVTNPGYLDPFFRGWGLVWLGLTGLSVAFGVALVLRMVQGSIER